MRTVRYTRTLSVLLACLLAACSGKAAEQTAKPAAAPAENASPSAVYRVVTELNTAPFIIRDGKNITGFEYDLLNAIAQKQGFTLSFSVHPWQGIFKNLDNDDADIVAGAVTYTEERHKIMDFSEPHFTYDFTMMVKPELKDTAGFAALKGKKIALQTGSVSERFIPMLEANQNKIVYTDTIWLASKEMMRGYADAALGSSAPLSYYAERYKNEAPSALIKDASVPQQHYVFAVKKGNTALVEQLNAGLSAVKADGTYDKLYQKYWGSTATDHAAPAASASAAQ